MGKEPGRADSQCCNRRAGPKEGDQIEIRVVGKRAYRLRRDRNVQRAPARLRKLRRPLPAGFVFDREEANTR
jgi:antitoxin MazE